ncbi:zona pellucida sperm-binding protein 3-like [Xyrichtys novacula]|uniref:Zona pellucida sperm-binding protein 3 n=1 Tax=Xyrichtys novacula TaxID=13765 RepID=A0AAV1HNG4_XYRNO|nr:zona pellucida sperm-binding protein 3-like [Xyrichtys novacula]
MTTRDKSVILLFVISRLLSVGSVANDEKVENVDKLTPDETGLEVKCGEVNMVLIVKWLLFDQMRIPFQPEYLRLGLNTTKQRSCEPTAPMSGTEMIISAGLQECGTQSSVSDEWLIFSNQLLLFPSVVPTSSGSVIVRGSTTVIPVECHYKRKQTVNGEPITPTWLPMTSTISAFGLLHFSLHTMEDDCSFLRSSSVYQQGEAVFLEASIEAPFHPSLTLYVDHCVATLKPDPKSSPSYKFITQHGCLIDGILPGSSSKFLPRKKKNRLCFSVQAFRFTRDSGEQMFITCHLRVTLKQNSHSHLDKSCFFHRPTFRWHSADADDALCGSCRSDDDSGIPGQRLDTEKRHEADSTVGPLITLPGSHWPGHLSVNP